jgi:hypothetical protein
MSNPRVITEISGLKICRKCGEVKEKSQFYKQQNACRHCIVKAAQARRAKDRAHYISIRDKAQRKLRSTPKGKIDRAISTSIRLALKGNERKVGRRWEDLVGYSADALRMHLEKLFSPGMTWENYGEWHIDHIVPVSAFNFSSTKDIDFKRCWNLKNLQPLWGKENISKRNRLSEPFQPSLSLAVVTQ